MNSIYKTRETSIATFLIAEGAKYLHSEEITPGTFWFVFEDNVMCYKLEQEYLTIKDKLINEIKKNDNSRA